MHGCNSFRFVRPAEKKTQSSRAQRLAILALISLCWVNAQAPRALASEPWPAEFQDDADLHDVHFVDANHGWAVGDRGVILHTRDGGVTWDYQSCPNGDSLRSVHFLDTKIGWAVGGVAVPHTQRGRAVVLRTDNGGRTWMIQPAPTLPALREVQFFDKQTGIAIGDASTLYSAGAFTTRDGGRTWTPFPVRTTHGWVASDFQSNGRGLLLSADGRITTCDGANCRARPTPRFVRGEMRDITWIDNTRAIAVGDFGTLWISHDAGTRWQDISQRIRLSGAAREREHPHSGMPNLRAVSADGENIWIGSDRGSQLLHSPDGGVTWQTTPMHAATSLPINRLAFHDASNQGWATGPLGRILRSTDRGATWQCVRGNNRRLFALVVAASERDIPWPLLAQIGGEFGGRTRLIVAQKAAPLAHSMLSMRASERLTQAALAVGANNAESVRLTQTSDVARVAANAALHWNPDLVVTAGRDDFNSQVASTLRAISTDKRAIQVWQSVANADATLASGPKNVSSIRISSSEIASSLGASLNELTLRARGILHQPPSDSGLHIHCYPLAIGNAARGRRITDGFALAAGSASRRAAARGGDNRRQMEQRAQHNALVQQLIKRASADPTRSAAWLSQIENMATRLPPASAANTLYLLSQQQFAAGNAPGAIASLHSINTKYPSSGLNDAALRDAVLYLTSREVKYRQSFNERANAAKVDKRDKAELAGEGPVDAPATSNEEHGKTKWLPVAEAPIRRGQAIPASRVFKGGSTIADELRIRPASAVIGQSMKPNAASSSLASLSELSHWMARLGPEHRSDPDLQLAIESHRRRTRQPGSRQQAVYQRLARSLPGGWRDCASAELALFEPERITNKPILQSTFSTRPHLDGLLNFAGETTWPNQQTEPSGKQQSNNRVGGGNDRRPSEIIARLQTDNTQSSPPGTVYVAADEEFLYFAVRCQIQPDADYVSNDAPRTRDADLTDHDRIDILIDTDRDYSVAWKLTLDHRGWTGESLGTDKSWNPQWYVAASGVNATTRDSVWICEAAIPWSELGDSLPNAEDPWALSIVRKLPDGGRQQWPAPVAEPSQLENAGLFYFVK